MLSGGTISGVDGRTMSLRSSSALARLQDEIVDNIDIVKQLKTVEELSGEESGGSGTGLRRGATGFGVRKKQRETE